MQASPLIRLRKDRLRDLADSRGLKNDAALAAHLGVPQSTVMRLLKGSSSPGEKTIAAVLAAFPGIKFEALFEVVGAKVKETRSGTPKVAS